MRYLDSFEFIISCISLWGMVLVLTLEMFWRFAFGHSLPWTDEVSRFCFVVTVFATASYAAKHERHMRLNMFVNHLPNKLRRVISVVADIVWIGFNLVVVVAGVAVVRNMLTFNYHSAILDLPMYYIYAVIPLFYSTMTIRVMRRYLIRLGRN